jgi:hypothetical protein
MYARSLFHPDINAPAGEGRDLRAGDVIRWFPIRDDAMGVDDRHPGPVVWRLDADPVRDEGGTYGTQLVNATPIVGGVGQTQVWLSAFDIVGCGNYRLVSEVAGLGWVRRVDTAGGV